MSRAKHRSGPSSSSSPEPRRIRPPAHAFARPTRDLFRPWAIGAAIALVGLGVAAGWAGKNERWEAAGADCAQATGCQRQRCSRDAQLDQVTGFLEQSIARRKELVTALTERTSPGFGSARQALEREATMSHRLATKQAALQAVPSHKGGELGVTLLWLLLSFVAGQRLAQGAGTVPSLRWDQRSYAWGGGLATLVLVAHFVAELTTSVFAAHKSIFSWHSFCVSPRAWGFAQAEALGVCLALVYPFTLAYALGDRSARQEPQLDHPDGKCGVGSYVKVARWASLIGLSVAAVGVVVGFDVVMLTRRALAPLSLLMPLTLLGVAVFLLWRVLGNVLWVRCRYRAKSWQQELAGDTSPRAPDPTLRFFQPLVWVPVLTLVVAAAVCMLLRHFSIISPAVDQTLIGLLG